MDIYKDRKKVFNDIPGNYLYFFKKSKNISEGIVRNSYPANVCHRLTASIIIMAAGAINLIRSEYQFPR